MDSPYVSVTEVMPKVQLFTLLANIGGHLGYF